MRVLAGLLLAYSTGSFAETIAAKEASLIEARAEQAVMAVAEPYAHALRSHDQSVEQAKALDCYARVVAFLSSSARACSTWCLRSKRRRLR